MTPAMHVVTPMMRLQDPKQTKMLIVTLPETTPVLEAESLQADLRRAVLSRGPGDQFVSCRRISPRSAARGPRRRGTNAPRTSSTLGRTDRDRPLVDRGAGRQ